MRWRQHLPGIILLPASTNERYMPPSGLAGRGCRSVGQREAEWSSGGYTQCHFILASVDARMLGVDWLTITSWRSIHDAHAWTIGVPHVP